MTRKTIEEKNIPIFKINETIELLKKVLPKDPVIVEAGAYNGRDTKKLATTWPLATVYAFEPTPNIFTLLEENTQHLPNVIRKKYALSKTTGTAKLHVSQNPTSPSIPFQANSLLAPQERLKWSNVIYPETIAVKTVSLDEWAEQNNIKKIDFLWLDLQGMALPVLQGSKKILQSTTAIFCEVEFIQAYKGQSLYQEVVSWLEDQGFVYTARDFSDIKGWYFGNVLCIKKK